MLRFDEKHLSGITRLTPKGDAVKLAKVLTQEMLVVTGRCCYLGLLPHFYLDDEQLVEAAADFKRATS